MISIVSLSLGRTISNSVALSPPTPPSCWFSSLFGGGVIPITHFQLISILLASIHRRHHHPTYSSFSFPQATSKMRREPTIRRREGNALDMVSTRERLYLSCVIISNITNTLLPLLLLLLSISYLQKEKRINKKEEGGGGQIN